MDTLSPGKERFRCAEALFEPSLLGRQVSGVHDCIYDSILKSDFDIRTELCENIVLSGGTSLLPGFADRMKKELTALFPSSRKFRIITPQRPQYSTWIGGSIFGSLSYFPQLSISKEEYNECGSKIVDERCPNFPLYDEEAENERQEEYLEQVGSSLFLENN